MRCAATVLQILLASTVVVAEAPSLPDLDVTYICQRPLHIGYWIDYQDNVPRYWLPDATAPGGKKEVTRDEWDRTVKHQHAPGDNVTFTAHVRNNGFALSAETEYQLFIDDKVVEKGKVRALQPDEEQVIPYVWVFQEGRHTISCEVDAGNKIKEICETNNRLTDPTYGIGLTIRAWDEANYKGFRSTPNLWGSYSFEDWCQAHIQEWRKGFREAIYPSTPQGILQGIRFDGIYTSLDDPGIKEVRASFRDAFKRFGRDYDGIPAQEREWFDTESCNWRINWTLDDIPNYAKKIDRGLIHELCHQCGIIDLYQFGLHPNAVLVTDPGGHFLWNSEGCYHQYNDLMAVAGENIENPLEQHGLFLEHTAAAFNSEIGRPRWGFGLYLFDVPQHNVLRILDNRGNPIAGAEVKLYQQLIEDRIVGKIPPKVGKTDASGEWDVGSHPVDKIHVVGTNGIMVIGIQAYGQWEFHNMVISEFNIAYWRGDKDRHVYSMYTGIAPPGAVPAPTNVKAETLAGKKVRLTWDYPSGERNLYKFLVLKRPALNDCVYQPAFGQIAGEVWPHQRTLEVEAKDYPRDLFVVVAVDQMGSHSGYSNIVVSPNDDLLPVAGRILGLTRTPDGSIYVLNSDLATLYGLSPKGGRISMAETVRMEGQDAVWHMVSDSRGLVYVPYPKGGYIYRIDAAKEKMLDNLKSDGLTQPRGIAIDDHANLYVTDLVDKTIHIITTEGKVLGSIGRSDSLTYPRAVYVDKEGTVYVVDCRIDKAQYRQSPATICVYHKTSKDGWDYERTLTIERQLFAIECVLADDEGRIYAGGSGGIHAFDREGKKLAQWAGHPYGTNMGAELVADMKWDLDGTLLVSQGMTLLKLTRVTREEILTAKDQ